MSRFPPNTVLTFGLPITVCTDLPAQVYRVLSIDEAIGVLRMVRVDVIVVGMDRIDAAAWTALHRIARCCDQSRWMLVCGEFTAEHEIHARSLGADLVLCCPPSDRTVRECLTALLPGASLLSAS